MSNIVAFVVLDVDRICRILPSFELNMGKVRYTEICEWSGSANDIKITYSSSLQVPIQVNKYLAYSDGMRVIESGKISTHSPASDGLLFTELDR